EREVEVVAVEVDADVPASVLGGCEAGGPGPGERVEDGAAWLASGLDAPFSECGWHDGEVGLGEGLCGDAPYVAGVAASRGVVAAVWADRADRFLPAHVVRTLPSR